MSGRIYLLHGDSELLAMEETAYESEKLLQEMLAKHPDLLAGEQINGNDPRRWLLVTREMAVQGEEGSSRWSLDHLFLDQSAVPTLVEVKKGTNTDVRRKVIGQMLDYAANAVAYWPVEDIRAKFESRCERDNEAPEDILSDFLDDDDAPDEFWQRVKTNLQAGRIRMVFLSDYIPPELRRVVEFLNEQMDPAEVIAIEVKQFAGAGMRTLVPRVIGQTEAAIRKKNTITPSAKQWDKASFLSALQEAEGEKSRDFAEALLDWISPQVTALWWGHGSKHGGVVPTIQHGNTKYQLFRLGSHGVLAFRFDWLYKKAPFSDEQVRRSLLEKINSIPGVHFDDNVLTKRAIIRFDKLFSPQADKKLRECLSWLIEQLHRYPNEAP